MTKRSDSGTPEVRVGSRGSVVSPELSDPLRGSLPDHGRHSGRRGCPVPIIELRVTSEAKRSSFHPSVPRGRSGSTR